jgi:hypothetical protein
VTGQAGISKGYFEVWIQDAPIGDWSVTCMAWTKADFTSGNTATYPTNGANTQTVHLGSTDQPTLTFTFRFKFEQIFAPRDPGFPPVPGYDVAPDPDVPVDVQGGY